MGIAKMFTKDVVLLTPADGDFLPRGTKRATLHDEGRIANIVEFQSSWSERKVREHIENCFKEIIDPEKPYPRYSTFI